MRVTISLFRDGTLWTVQSDDLPGAITHGHSLPEALDRFGVVALDLWDVVQREPDTEQRRLFAKVFGS